MVTVNCIAMTNMCSLVLPRMLEKSEGVIVNVSSVASAGFIEGSVYSATKSYISMLSECLQRTYKNTGRLAVFCIVFILNSVTKSQDCFHIKFCD